MTITQLDLPFATRYCPPEVKPFRTSPESMTHQECARDCDVNYIMQKYVETGVMPSGTRLPIDGAIMSSVGQDFQAIMDSMVQARQEFESLPAKLRDRFANDPARLVAFLGDSANRDEAIKLGLIAAPEKGAGDVNPQKGEAVAKTEA